MTAISQELIQEDESAVLSHRAKVYVLVRLSIDVVSLAIALLQTVTDLNGFTITAVLLADIAGLLLYWGAVRRWPTASTYLQIIFAILLLIAFDFALGAAIFIPWFLMIPLSIVGGLIVVRVGFNSLVTLSILTIFGAYTGLLLLGRITLPLAIPASILGVLAAALAVTILIINIFIESLVVYLYQNEETLLQSRAQLLYLMQELEQNRYRLDNIQNQTRRLERFSTVGQIADQLGKSLWGPLEEIDHLLRKPGAITKNSDVVKKLSNQVQVALHMLDGLRAYSGLSQLHIRTVTLDDVLVEELARVQIPSNIKLTIHQPPVFPPIQADPEKIHLIVKHLLNNALQALKDGGELSVELKSRPDGVQFSISDTGQGIAAEHLQKIFEPLYTTQNQGFGLGLAIVQRVVEMHGGYIEVDSEEGKGATFTVFLPRVPEISGEAFLQQKMERAVDDNPASDTA